MMARARLCKSASVGLLEAGGKNLTGGGLKVRVLGQIHIPPAGHQLGRPPCKPKLQCPFGRAP